MRSPAIDDVAEKRARRRIANVHRERRLSGVTLKSACMFAEVAPGALMNRSVTRGVTLRTPAPGVVTTS